MKKQYYVSLPVAGIIAVVIDEAVSEEDAINQALAQGFSIDLTPDKETDDITLEELDTYEKTIEGNVNYTPLWKAEAEEI